MRRRPDAALVVTGALLEVMPPPLQGEPPASGLPGRCGAHGGSRRLPRSGRDIRALAAQPGRPACRPSCWSRVPRRRIRLPRRPRLPSPASLCGRVAPVTRQQPAEAGCRVAVRTLALRSGPCARFRRRDTWQTVPHTPIWGYMTRSGRPACG